MRRKDREVTDESAIDEIIEKCSVCRLAFSDEKAPYMVPMNFGYEKENGERVLYFHGAGEGRKADLIRKNGYAAFEMDTEHRLGEGEKACNYTYFYSSVMGEGKIEFVTSFEDKIKGLNAIMSRFSDKESFEYNEALVARVSVIKLTVSSISAKRH